MNWLKSIIGFFKIDLSFGRSRAEELRVPSLHFGSTSITRPLPEGGRDDARTQDLGELLKQMKYDLYPIAGIKEMCRKCGLILIDLDGHECKETQPEQMKNLVGNMDALEWAKQFCRMNPAAYQDYMQGWFANAIMAGYDTATNRLQAKVEKYEKALNNVGGLLMGKVEEIDIKDARHIIREALK